MVMDDSDKDKAFLSDAPKAQPEDTSDVGGGDGTPLNPKDPLGVQFIPASGRDPLNGDAKVEIGDTITVQFTGLGKEELMKYANDPFWVRLRWALFILFWLIWLAMLVGAIVIIVLAPKCKEPKHITDQIIENGPYYQLDLKTFGNLQGLKDKSAYLKDLGVKTLILSNMVDDTDFEKLSPEHGNVTDLKDVVTELNNEGIRVLLQFIPNHSGKNNQWFTKNPDYYVTLGREEAGKSTWKTVVGDSPASAWNDLENSTTKSYLGQFGPENPDFDYKNEVLIAKINGILKHWYTKTGIDGFFLSAVSYLKENMNDLTNQNGTINQDANKVILQKLLKTKDWELGEGRDPYALLEVNQLSESEALEKYGGQVFTPVTTVDLPRAFTAQDLKNEFDTEEGEFPIRRLSASPNSRFSSKYDDMRGSILALMAYLSKGQVLWYYGDEAGLRGAEQMNFNSSETILNFYKEIAKVSQNIKKSKDEKVEFVVKNDTDVLAFQRDSYVVVINLSNQEENVDVVNLLKLDNPGKLMIQFTTPGSNARLVSEGVYMLPAFSGLVLHQHKEKESTTTTPTTA